MGSTDTTTAGSIALRNVFSYLLGPKRANPVGQSVTFDYHARIRGYQKSATTRGFSLVEIDAYHNGTEGIVNFIAKRANTEDPDNASADVPHKVFLTGVNKIQGLTETPTVDTDAATKLYVDTAISGVPLGFTPPLISNGSNMIIGSSGAAVGQVLVTASTTAMDPMVFTTGFYATDSEVSTRASTGHTLGDPSGANTNAFRLRPDGVGGLIIEKGVGGGAFSTVMSFA
jgi:hypothetical protein